MSADCRTLIRNACCRLGKTVGRLRWTIDQIASRVPRCAYPLMLAQSYPPMNKHASRLRMPDAVGSSRSSDSSHPSRTLAEAHSLAVRRARTVDWRFVP